jgi:hypothetical protein
MQAELSAFAGFAELHDSIAQMRVKRCSDPQHSNSLQGVATVTKSFHQGGGVVKT